MRDIRPRQRLDTGKFFYLHTFIACGNMSVGCFYAHQQGNRKGNGQNNFFPRLPVQQVQDQQHKKQDDNCNKGQKKSFFNFKNVLLHGFASCLIRFSTGWTVARVLFASDECSAFAAAFFQQHDVADDDFFIHRFTHIVNGQCGDAYGRQGFHFHAGFPRYPDRCLDDNR